MAFFCLSVIVFMYVGYGSCASYLQAWLGFLPMILVASGVQAGESCFQASTKLAISHSCLRLQGNTARTAPRHWRLCTFWKMYCKCLILDSPAQQSFSLLRWRFTLLMHCEVHKSQIDRAGNAYLSMPTRGKTDDRILQIWLQARPGCHSL